MQPVRVQALPWPVLEALQPLLRKLAHDLGNALVAGVTMADVLAMQSGERTGLLASLRPYLLRPREVLDTAVNGLPEIGVRPRAWMELRRELSDHAAVRGVELRWRAPSTAAALPTWLAEADWCLAAWTLLHNGLDAHAAAVELDEGVPEPWVEINCREEGLLVSDNGPGCTDLLAVAAGTVRRRGGGHLGLGLSVLAAVVERSGGGVFLAPRPGGGVLASVRPAA
jgi:hypothetical protein